MPRGNEKDLDYYLSLEYGYTVIPDEDEFFVRFPDLPGCMTQVERAEDIHSLAQEIKELWLKTALDANQFIAEPVDEQFSGKFLVRVPKSLHRDLVHQAKQEGMSLNSFVMHLLSSRSIQSRLDNLELSAIVSQPSASQSNHLGSGSHQFLMAIKDPYSQDSSYRKKRHRVLITTEDGPIVPTHLINPPPVFAS